MSEPKPKKMVSRNVAVALGIICIVLVAFIAYFTVTGISAQNSYNNLKNQNNQLQTWLDGNETLLNQTQANNTNLQNQMNNLTDILNLSESTTLYNGTVSTFPTVEPANLEESAPYAGYVSVQVSSTLNETVTITVVWDYYPILRYQNDFNLGNNGTAIFPVLPTGFVVYFFDPNAPLTETANVTITYYY
jgi:cell division protein FtsB